MRLLVLLLARWQADRGQVRVDGLALIREYGDRAYEIARRMARAERSGRLISPSLQRGHWDRVRREVKRTQTQQARAPHHVAGGMYQGA